MISYFSYLRYTPTNQIIGLAIHAPQKHFARFYPLIQQPKQALTKTVFESLKYDLRYGKGQEKKDFLAENISYLANDYQFDDIKVIETENLYQAIKKTISETL